jgi:DNA-binding NarL/FixJ family response regulator
MGVIRVAVIEDQLQTRQMFMSLIGAKDDVFVCAALFESAEAAIAGIPDLDIDVVLVDIHLPGGMSGIDCVRLLKASVPQAEYLMCTSLEDSESIFKALQAGATGYITKSTPQDKILEAISDVHNGGSPMSSQVARKVLGHFHNAETVKKNTEIEKLSIREQEILDYLSKGYRYKEIATMLFVSIETVRKHIHNIYEKLQVNSRTDALNKAYTQRK